jgi:hypothetical protein
MRLVADERNDYFISIVDVSWRVSSRARRSVGELVTGVVGNALL